MKVTKAYYCLDLMLASKVQTDHMTGKMGKLILKYQEKLRPLTTKFLGKFGRKVDKEFVVADRVVSEFASWDSKENFQDLKYTGLKVRESEKQKNGIVRCLSPNLSLMEGTFKATEKHDVRHGLIRTIAHD